MARARLFRMSLLSAIILLAPGNFGRTDLAAAERSPLSSADREIIGTWKLVSIYEEDDRGYELNEFEDGAIGDLIVGRGNNFSLQIFSPAARRYTPKGASCVSAAGLIDAITYFGTYSIDARNQKLTLHIDKCLFRKCDRMNSTISLNILDDTMDWISAGEPSPTGAAYSHIVWQRACCSVHH